MSIVKRTLVAVFTMWLFVPGVTAKSTLVEWQPWSSSIFDQAKAQNKFVLLDLEAVWCHWCHVMDDKTYGNERVASVLKSHYIAVRVDQDANPDLSNRYGDWGWPATIVFTPDGKEIVKRRGYIPPVNMLSMLQAIIEDPSPGPSVQFEPPVVPSNTPILEPHQRATLLKQFDDFYDHEHGGWGTIHKFIDVDSVDLELARAGAGDKAAARRAKQTLDGALNLIDPVEGGIYQYSDKLDWSSPHYEKIMWYQANGLRQFALAYLTWKDDRYRTAANRIARYLLTVLRSPDGAFYTSQDADVSQELPGKVYYALNLEQRHQLKKQPKIDKNKYARENAWAIRGLVAHYAATNDRASLDAALAAANWVIDNRSLDDGGFRHGASDRGGPFLGDSLAMGQAALDLYEASGERRWLDVAMGAGEFIAKTFQDKSDGGFATTATPESNVGVFKTSAKPLEEQVRTTRFFNRLFDYFGTEKYKKLAHHGARYLFSSTVLGYRRPLPGLALVDMELRNEPVHMTIVGAKTDARARQLHLTGQRYPSVYKRLDWWDKSEGPLPNPDVTYPQLEVPAAFACTNKICSLPITDPSNLHNVVDRLRAPRHGKPREPR